METTPNKQIEANQLEANRANAQLSTGPITAEGKKRSSQNATKHGLTGRTVLLPGEDLNFYMAFSKELVDSFNPETPLEKQLAQNIADAQWRLNRIKSLEDGMLALGQDEPAGDFDAANEAIHAAMTAARAFRDDSKSFVNLSIYEQRIQRGMSNTIKQLAEIQTKRREQYQRDMDEAIRLYKVHEMKSQPWEPREDGFVY